MPNEENTPKSNSQSTPENKERMTLSEAFTLGDGHDDERAVRACALLLEWASDVGNDKVDGFLAFGISQALQLAAGNRAGNMAQAHRRSISNELERLFKLGEDEIDAA